MMILDLCAGLGGASQAFDQDQVVKVDIDRSFKPTIQADVKHLPFKSDLKPNLVIFCPPCQCFSVASIVHYWNRDGSPKPETEKAIRLVREGLEELKRLNPRYWIMENPMGMLRTVIGKPPHTIRMSDYGGKTKKPTDLWGNVPFKMLSAMKPWPPSPRKVNLIKTLYKNPAERAKWPYGLSEAIKETTISTYKPEVKMAKPE